MKNQSGRVRWWTLLCAAAFLAVLLAGWKAMPQPTPERTAEPGQTPILEPLRSVRSQGTLEGDVERGRDLFMGRLHFQNGGPPCMGCHNVGQNGLLGGGAMGPDLTNVSRERSQTEILGFLSNTGRNISPVMRAIYISHPLTWEEQSDVLAFLVASAGQPQADREFLVLGISLAGFIVVAGLLGFVYRGRMRGARTPLIRKVREKQLWAQGSETRRYP